MPRLLYIASLPHSGSTLLNLLVGNSPQMIGLGGIDRAMRMLLKDREKTATESCSCGSSVRDCVYWGEVLKRSESTRPKNLIDRYALALDTFESVFGPEKLPVDSSKIKEPIFELSSAKELNLDLRVVHLAKDIRTATISMIDTKRRKKGTSRPGLIMGFESAWRWWRENSKLQRCGEDTGVPLFNLGYEELCLSFDRAFGALCEFSGTSHDSEQSLRIGESTSHLFIGNRMRNEGEKAELRYDYRWFTRSEWKLPLIMIPALQRSNKRWVYSNGGDATIRL